MLKPCFEFKAARIKAGYRTQKSLAEASGVSASRISDIERGGIEAIPKITTIRRLAEVLDVSREELLSWLVTYF